MNVLNLLVSIPYGEGNRFVISLFAGCNNGSATSTVSIPYGEGNSVYSHGSDIKVIPEEEYQSPMGKVIA